MNFVQKFFYKLNHQTLMEEDYNIAIIGYQGCGKSTLSGAIQYLLGGKGIGNRGGELSLAPTRLNVSLERIINNIKAGGENQFPTKHRIDYQYDFLYVAPGHLWAYQVGRIHLHDNPGGYYDNVQTEEFAVDKKYVEQLRAELKKDDAILLLFSLEQFMGAPMETRERYLQRENIYNFLESIHEAIKSDPMPITIAVNHCVINDEEQLKPMNDALDTLKEWISGIFSDMPDEFIPNIYFIDSVAAIQEKGRWKTILVFPLLDLMRFYLKREGIARQKSRFIWGDIEEARQACNKFIRDTINSGGAARE